MSRDQQAAGAEARAILHGSLARLFLAPEAEESVTAIDALAAKAELPAHLRALDLTSLGLAWRSSPGGVEALEQEWHDLFEVPLERYVAPYESVHVAPASGDSEVGGSMLMGGPMASLNELYAACEYEVEVTHSQLPDHVGMELGFLACLAARESAGWRHGANDVVEDARRAQSRFIELHPGRWLDTLARRVREKSRLQFHPAAARLAADAVAADREALRG